MRTAAIILAAGASSRLGEPKQLVLLGEERLLDRSVRTAREAGCKPILIVLGANANLIAATCDLTATIVVINPDWQEGMAASIRAGVKALQPQHADSALVLACDQPAVTAEHLRRLVVLGAGQQEPIASSYAGRKGVPAWFPATRFPDLLALSGDAGARNLLLSATCLALEHGDLDVDTPTSLQTARGLYG